VTMLWSGRLSLGGLVAADVAGSRPGPRSGEASSFTV
jgi:hypothetical protein